MSQVPPSTTRRLPRPERRSSILDAALPVFARHGYAAASINEVVRATGVAKPVVYEHFDSKRGLYVALLERESECLLSRVAGSLDPTRPLDERLRSVVAGLLSFVRAHPDTARLLLRSADGDELVQAAHERHRTAALRAATAIILADPAFTATPGLSRRVSAEVHAELQVAAFSRIALYALEHPHAPARALTAIVLDVFWTGLSGPAEWSSTRA